MNFLSINLRGVRDDRKTAWVRGLKTSNGIQFVGIQESKLGPGSDFVIASFWGRSRFQSEMVFAEGRSGGIISLWDPTIFRKTGVIKNRSFLVVTGELVASGENINIVNIYAPNDAGLRRVVWAELLQVKRSLPGMWVFFGDFNEVRSQSERRNTEFVPASAGHFNDFIARAELFEFNMGDISLPIVRIMGKK